MPIFGKGRREPEVRIENIDDNKGSKTPSNKDNIVKRFLSRNSLTPTQERAWQLHEKGWSGKQIAKELKISEDAAYQHVSRARGKMGRKNTPRTKTGNLLTPNQEEIYELKRQGWSNRQVAEQLGIKEKTVKGHVTNINKSYKEAGKSAPFARSSKYSGDNVQDKGNDSPYASDREDSRSDRRYG